MSIDKMNRELIDTAYHIVEKIDDIDKVIFGVKALYDSIEDIALLMAKRRLEMVLFRLFVIKYYTVDQRTGVIDRGLYCRQTEEGAAYRADVIRRFDQTFDRQRSMVEFMKKAIDYLNAGNNEKAFEYFMKSALEGSTISAYQCGKMLMAGEGCEQDAFLAAFWHWQSVNMNNENAIASLAYDYYDGRGVFPGKVRAMHWFATGANMLEKTCIRELADMLKYGEVISGEEDTGKPLEASLGRLDDPEIAEYVRSVSAAVNVITAEWLQEHEGGI